MTFLILACAIPNPKIFYPFFVLLFYVLTVLPVFIAQRANPGGNDLTNPKTEFAFFLAAGMLLSAFALPIVLANSGVVSFYSIRKGNGFHISILSKMYLADKLDGLCAYADKQRY